MRKYLFAILLFAAFLRFTGIKPGYPPYHSDEGMSYSQGIYILIDETLDANGYSLHYAYPGLVPIIHALAYKYVFIPFAWLNYHADHFENYMDGYMNFLPDGVEYERIFRRDILGERERNVLVWGRTLTALVGVGVVYMTYRLAKILFEEKVGLAAALLVAVNYRQVLNSHLALPDIYNAFFLLISTIFSLAIINKPSRLRYLLAGVFIGLSLSTKFHVYSIFPFFLAHLYSIREKTWKTNKGEILFDEKIIITGMTALTILLIINPYHFINYTETVKQLKDVSLKYRVGKNYLDYYPLYYLYKIGVGKLTSLFVIAGVMLSLIKNTSKSLILLSVVLPFFYIMIYLTGGGFYTRNFVTITPFLLIFAAYLLVKITSFESRKISFLLLASILLLLVYENFPKSIVVANEYRRPWNVKILSDWINNNIPVGSRIAAHSSVPLPEEVVRLPFEQSVAFSVREFRQEGANFAVMNLDWATNDFYWWMTQSTKNSLKYLEKPVRKLENTYPAMVIRELSDYSIFSVANSPYAPDSNFVVAKIPEIRLVDKLDRGIKLVTSEEKVDEIRRFEPVFVGNWDGLVLDYVVKTKSKSVDRDGFVFVEFFKSEVDALNFRNRIAVRLSPRNIAGGDYNADSLILAIPRGSRYMRVGLGIYQKSQAVVYFRDMVVYKANVEEKFDGWSINSVKLDDGIVFPNSHGNL